MNYSNYNLFKKYPGYTYQNLMQYVIESSSIADGNGNAFTGSLNVSVSYASVHFIDSSSFSSTSISSSWASSSVSSSYSPINPTYSSSVSSQFGTKQNTLIVGNTYSITSSWTNNLVGGIGAILITGSTYQITSSQSMSSSFSQTSSFALNAGNNSGTTLITASIYQITSSWSNNSISASYAPGGSTATYTSSLFGTASWAKSSISASYVPGSSTATYTSSLFGTASWAISSSYAPGNSAATYTSSLFGTSSWAVNTVNGGLSISSSWSSQSAFAPVIFSNVQIINGQLLILSSDTGNWYSLGVTDDGSGSFTTNLSSASISGSSYASGTFYSINSFNLYTTQSGYSTSSLSSSWASQSLSSSYTKYIPTYTTLSFVNTSSTNWITASFSLSNQEVDIKNQGNYSFTASNLPPLGNISDILIHLNNSSVTSSTTCSLLFPSDWINYGSGWPTYISGSKTAIIWLRYGPLTGSIMGTYIISN